MGLNLESFFLTGIISIGFFTGVIIWIIATHDKFPVK